MSPEVISVMMAVFAVWGVAVAFKAIQALTRREPYVFSIWDGGMLRAGRALEPHRDDHQVRRRLRDLLVVRARVERRVRVIALGRDRARPRSRVDHFGFRELQRALARGRERACGAIRDRRRAARVRRWRTAREDRREHDRGEAEDRGRRPAGEVGHRVACSHLPDVSRSIGHARARDLVTRSCARRQVW